MASSQRPTANKRPPPCPSGNRHNYTPLLKWYSFRFTITTCNKRLTKIIFNKISIQFFSCSPGSVHQSRVIVRLRVYWFMIHRYYAWGFAQKIFWENFWPLSHSSSKSSWALRVNRLSFPPFLGELGFTWELRRDYLPLTLPRHSPLRTLPLTPCSLVDGVSTSQIAARVNSRIVSKSRPHIASGRHPLPKSYSNLSILLQQI